MNIILFWSFVLYSLLIPSVISANVYKGDCAEIQSIINESKCSEEKCLKECIVNSEGKVTTLNIDDIRLTDEDIKRILSYKTISFLNYQAHCPVQSTCIQKDEKFPSVISELTNLKELNYTYNRLYEKRKTHKRYYTTINSNLLNKLKSLKKLKISYVEISEDNINEISSLTNLTSLNLSNCPMNGLSFSFLKKMKKLNTLNVNNFKESSDVIDHLKSIKKLRNLSLSFNSFVQEDIEKISELTDLEELYRGIDENTVELDFKSLNKLTELNKLTFENYDYTKTLNLNNISFTKFKYLESLNFFYVNITQENINDISKLRHIEALSLENCGLDVNFSPMKNLKKLRDLYIYDCYDNLCNYDQILSTICSFKKLEKLTVNFIYGTLPNKFANLKKLEYLDLGYNNFETFPDVFKNFKILQYLNLNGNQITKLPDSIGKLEDLTYFEMHGNKLKRIPDTIGDLLNLEYLELNENEIENMPESLGNLKKLEYLNLEKNNIKDEIPESLNSLSRLKKVYLKNNYEIKGKTLTNPSLEECEFVDTSKTYDYQLCIDEQTKCMDDSYNYSSLGLLPCA